ncbi:cytochrome c oxidase subunit 3 [Denitromonas ohlonensis]|nr:cytochrome c oxidase subunit 3 [Denitromonas ohlonensis]
MPHPENDMTQNPPDLATEEAVSILRGRHLPGVLVFIIADMAVFCMLFVGFMVDRMKDVALFNNSAIALDVRFGVANTLILVTSGLFVVLAVNAARAGLRKTTRGWLLLSFLVGAGFGVSKIVEYSIKISSGITMQTNPFYMYYYALTGAHFLHFVGGMIALAVLWVLAGREATVSRNTFNLIESGALYWHMVDLLWLFLFPMLYLLVPR